MHRSATSRRQPSGKPRVLEIDSRESQIDRLTPTKGSSAGREHDPSSGNRESSIVPGLNCLSVDVEEYFHCEVFADRVRPQDWSRLECRAAPFLERLAVLLDRYHSRATFFVLGWMVERLAPLLRSLVQAGHEIACHGDNHQHLARLDAQRLREDVHRARLRIEDTLGLRPRGYRAPTFSVTRATAWALDVIMAEGFEYDASIFPIHHDRYGVPGAPAGPFWAVAPSGRRILEFPPLTLDWGPLRVPLGGGGYLRLLPAGLLSRCIGAHCKRGQPVMLYVHPWELDPDQPRLPVGRGGWLSGWRHRVNLHTTAGKLERLLRGFVFKPAAEVLGRIRTQGALPVFELSDTAHSSNRSRLGATSETT